MGKIQNEEEGGRYGKTFTKMEEKGGNLKIWDDLKTGV